MSEPYTPGSCRHMFFLTCHAFFTAPSGEDMVWHGRWFADLEPPLQGNTYISQFASSNRITSAWQHAPWHGCPLHLHFLYHLKSKSWKDLGRGRWDDQTDGLMDGWDLMVVTVWPSQCKVKNFRLKHFVWYVEHRTQDSWRYRSRGRSRGLWRGQSRGLWRYNDLLIQVHHMPWPASHLAFMNRRSGNML
jgi:hypothetical protein